MANDRPKSTSVISQQFERKIQTQKLNKLIDAIEAEKKAINQGLSRKLSSADSPHAVTGLLLKFGENLNQIKEFIAKLDAEEQQQFAPTLKQLKGFLDRANKKLSSIEEEPVIEEKIPDVVLPEEEVKVDIEVERGDTGTSIQTQLSVNNTASLQKKESFLKRIENEANKGTQKELALSAILSVYSLEPIDEQTINDYLQTFLAIACPARFTTIDGKLALTGTKKSKILSALGISDLANSGENLKIDCRAFNWSALDDLKVLYPNETGLWSILKSIKPIDESYSVTERVNACFDVLQELSKSKLIKTGKLNQVLEIFKFAGLSAQEHHDTNQLKRLRSYFLMPKDGEPQATTQLKNWLKRKMTAREHDIKFPEVLVETFKNSPVLYTRDKDALSAWFSSERARLLTIKETEELKNKKLEILNAIKEFYDVMGHRFSIPMHELRDIVSSRLAKDEYGRNEYGLREIDEKKLQQYLDKLNVFIVLGNELQEKFSVPGDGTTLDQSLEQLIKMAESKEFKNFIGHVMTLAQSFDEINVLNEKYDKILDLRHAFDLQVHIQKYHLGLTFQAYAVYFVQILPRIPMIWKEINSGIQKLSLGANEGIFSPEVAHKSQEISDIFVGMTNTSNMLQTVVSAQIEAKKIYEDELKNNHEDNQQAAIKTMLHIHALAGNLGSNPEIHLNHYLKTMLPIAFPDLFYEEDGRLKVKTFEDIAAIYEALGSSLQQGEEDLNLNVTQFDPIKLDELKKLFPKEKALWSILKSLKPIDNQFTAYDKSKACIDLALEISQKEVIQTEKLKYALAVLNAAYWDVKEYTFEFDLRKKFTNSIILVTELKDDSFSYSVFDSNHDIQKGSIRFADLGVAQKDIDKLKTDDESKVVLFNTYRGRILEITKQRGHTYDKSNAIELIKKAFDTIDSTESEEEVDSLRMWLKKELATKRTNMSSFTSKMMEEEHIDKPKVETTSSKSASIFVRVWQFISTRFKKFIYDHFPTKENKQTPDIKHTRGTSFQANAKWGDETQHTSTKQTFEKVPEYSLQTQHNEQEEETEEARQNPGKKK